MKYANILTLFLITFLSACGSGENKTKSDKSNPFSSEKIITVLTDIQLVESLINTHGNFYNKDEQNILFQEVLDKHQISRESLDSILFFLETNLEYYQLIMDSVKINIEKIGKVNLPSVKYVDKKDIKVVKLTKDKKDVEAAILTRD